MKLPNFKKASELLAAIILTITTLTSFGQGPVSTHGRLQASGNRVVDKNNNEISLAGNSIFWSNFSEGAKFYNAETVNHLVDDWNASIVRASIGVQEFGGYLSEPARETAKAIAVADAAIAKDTYVILDWHSHRAEENATEAIAFFSAMSDRYKNDDHVIYEIYNEPVHQSWDIIRSYALRVIAAIRENDPDNLIIVGTPFYSQRVEDVLNNPIDDVNVAYTLHFYAGTHHQSLRDTASRAMNPTDPNRSGIPLFVTEWGAVNANGDGAANVTETQRWLDFMRANGISHCNWSITDKDEGSAVVSPNQGVSGLTSNNLTTTGNYIRNIIRSWESGEPVDPPEADPIIPPNTPAVPTPQRQGIVSKFGRLQASDNRVTSENGEEISLAGNSIFWSNFSEGAKFYNAETVNHLVNDWNSAIIRAAIGVHMQNGFLQQPTQETIKAIAVADSAIENDTYVIIDWHSHRAEENEAEAIAFFSAMSDRYKDNDHVIYEIFNEPIDQSWDTIRRYALRVIAAIRENDPDNLIIVGTPFFSQRVEDVLNNPIDDVNVAYTLHFYAGEGAHSQLRDAALRAMNPSNPNKEGIPLFVTEWGTVPASGNGAVNSQETAIWMDFLQANKISHCNWSIADKDEGSAAVSPNQGVQGLENNNLTTSGNLVRSIILASPDNAITPVELPSLESYIESFTSLPESQRAPLDDFDNDGFSNLLEYALGFHPAEFDSKPLPPQFEGDNILIDYEINSNAPDVAVDVEWSNNMNQWFTDGVTLRETAQTEGRQSMQAVLPNDNNSDKRLFWRIRAREMP